MKYAILAFTLYMICLPAGAGAETFSCRDKNGDLHVADNLMSLPADCRFQAKTLDETDPGKVNYVPPVENNPQTSQEYQQELQLQQQETTKRQQEPVELKAEATRLATSYQSAVSARYEAVRNREYGSRETIQRAERDMQYARTGKAQLLEKLKTSRVSTDQKDEITRLLEAIEN